MLPDSDHTQCPYVGIRIYTSYTRRTLWRSGYSLQLWMGKSSAQVLAAAVWSFALGQGTLPVRALSLPGSEWVPGWTVTAYVFK